MVLSQQDAAQQRWKEELTQRVKKPQQGPNWGKESPLFHTAVPVMMALIMSPSSSFLHTSRAWDSPDRDWDKSTAGAGPRASLVAGGEEHGSHPAVSWAVGPRSGPLSSVQANVPQALLPILRLSLSPNQVGTHSQPHPSLPHRHSPASSWMCFVEALSCF